MNTAKKSFQKLFSKHKNKPTKLTNDSGEENEVFQEGLKSCRNKENVDNQFLSDDDSFDEKIFKSKNFQATNNEQEIVDLKTTTTAVESCSGVYSTLDRSIGSPKTTSVPLLKMKSYVEIERETKERDSNLSLNEKIAMRIMSKNTVVYEEPEKLPEGLASFVFDEDGRNIQEGDVDIEMENFIWPLESLIQEDHPLRNKSSPLQDTRDDLSEMIKDVDNFILDLSAVSPTAPNGAGTWVSKHANATPYSQFSETKRLQKRLQEKVTAHVVSSKSTTPPPFVIAEKEVKVTSLVNMFESKASASSNSLPKANLEVVPTHSHSLASKTIVSEAEVDEDPVQALFLFISQLDTSTMEPMILDYLVKAVGAFAKELEIVKIEVGCQYECSGFDAIQSGVDSCDAECQHVITLQSAECQHDITLQSAECQHDIILQSAECQYESLEPLDAECQYESLEPLDAECQYESLEPLDAECQYDLKMVHAQVQNSTPNVSHSESQHDMMRMFDAQVQIDHALLCDAETQCDPGKASAVIFAAPEHLSRKPTLSQSMMKKLGVDFNKSLTLPRLYRSKSTVMPKTKSSSSPSEVVLAPSALQLTESVANTRPANPLTDSHTLSMVPELSHEIPVSVDDEYFETMAKLCFSSIKEENGTIVDVQVDQPESPPLSTIGKEILDEGLMKKGPGSKGLSMKASFQNLSRLFAKK